MTGIPSESVERKIDPKNRSLISYLRAISALIASIAALLAAIVGIAQTYKHFSETRSVIADSNYNYPSLMSFRDCDDCPEMVSIPEGDFIMGSTLTEEGRRENEGPLHSVKIEKFAIGKYEITWAEWEVCVKEKLCKPQSENKHRSDMGWGKGRRPVINVGLEGVYQYIDWLTVKTGKKYSLPSEAQWEYAARAGTSTPFSFGKSITAEQANFDGNYTYNNSHRGVYRQRTETVGSFPSNDFNLFDMHGNVWEPTRSCYVQYDEWPPQDYHYSKNCNFVYRSGSWRSEPKFIRSAYRVEASPRSRWNSDQTGFRVVRVIQEAVKN